jgi:hypothetical protein
LEYAVGHGDAFTQFMPLVVDAVAFGTESRVVEHDEVKGIRAISDIGAIGIRDFTLKTD